LIGIIDYGAGNLKSVEKAFQHLGEEVIITGDRDILLRADKVVLPGVGAFGEAMKQIRELRIDSVIREIVDMEKPLLGICLGLQLLFESSEENKGIKGLGILSGKVLRIPDEADLKVPHVGWNSLQLQNHGRLFKGISPESYVYFVHSYYLKAQDESIVKAATDYGVRIHASVEQGNIFGCQFHPEKSSDVGLHILGNFADL
jgi:glutamine amidotransferase